MQDHILLGLFIVITVLGFYALTSKTPMGMFAFAAACTVCAIYGWLLGEWPFAMIGVIWAAVELRRWWMMR